MFEVAYTLFMVVLVLQVLAFLSLNLPGPKGWKNRIVRFLNSYQNIKSIIKMQGFFCLMAGLFLVDSYRQESKLNSQKEAILTKDSYASELKYNYLSFLTLKVQRNEYITFMVVYIAIASTAYLFMLNYMHQKREKHNQPEQAEANSPVKKVAATN